MSNQGPKDDDGILFRLNRRKFLVASAFATAATVAPMRASAASKPWIGGPAWTGSDKKSVVVIGSGIGGMATAALLSKLGHRVHVLERHSLIGGHARHPEYQGLKFSMGPQYVWNFGSGGIGDRFLNYLGMSQSDPFVLMDPEGFETNFVGNRSLPGGIKCFEVPMGLDKFRDKLAKEFASEAKNIQGFFADIIEISEAYDSFLQRHTLSSALQVTLELLFTLDIPLLTKIKLTRATFSSLKDLCDQYHLSPMVRRILYGHGGIFLENESQISAMAYIVGTSNYHLGAHYPARGFYSFFDTLKSIVEQNGGSVLVNKKVVELKTKWRSVTEAVCEDGTVFPCDTVISDASPRMTNDLLPFYFRKHYSYTPSRSTTAIAIGLRGRAPGISAMTGRNYWWQTGPDEVDYLAPDPEKPTMLYVSSHTSNGFGNTERNPNDDSVVVFATGNYDVEKAIQESGPSAVAAFKAKLGQQVVDLLDRNLLPGIRSYVRFVEVVGTMDIVDQLGAERGNVYGRRMNVAELRTGMPADPDVSNLYNVSATRNGAGIAAGISTAATLVARLTGTQI